jgi:hypothetical protein
LRAASGEPSTGGSNLTDFKRGVRIRYDRVIPWAQSGYTALKAALVPGTAGVVQGSMKAFGTGHRLSVWQKNFDGGHAVLIVNIDGILYWCDPLAPETANVPVVASWSEVRAYVTAFSGQWMVRKLRTPPAPPAQEEDMNLTTYIPGHTADIKPGSNVRVSPIIKSTLLRTTPKNEPVVLIGTVKGDTDPANGSTVWYVWYKNDRLEYTAKDNIINVKAPVLADDGYTAATQAAAVSAARKAEREQLATAIADAIRNL